MNKLLYYHPNITKIEQKAEVCHCWEKALQIIFFKELIQTRRLPGP